MLLSELFSYCCDRSGQFIIGEDPAKFRLDMEKFWRIVQAEVRWYGRHRPRTKRSVLYSNLTYTFPTDDRPRLISNVVPVGGTILNPNAAMIGPAAPSVLLNQFENGEFLVPWGLRLRPRPSFPWRYIKETGTLYTAWAGPIDVQANYDLRMVETRGGTDDHTLVEVDLPDLELMTFDFVDLIYGRFLEAIGRSRRAFTYRDLPIEHDGVSMVQEGAEIYKDARDRIEQGNDWWKGIQ